MKLADSIGATLSSSSSCPSTPLLFACIQHNSSQRVMSDQEHDFGDLFGSENEESDLEETPSRATSPETRNRVESDAESQTNNTDQVLGKRPATR